MTAGLIVSTSTPCSMADGIRSDAVSPDSRRGLLWQHESRCRHLITIVPLQQLSQSRFRVGNYSNGVGLESHAFDSRATRPERRSSEIRFGIAINALAESEKLITSELGKVAPRKIASTQSQR